MDRVKNFLLASIALSVVALAIGQYQTSRVIAGAQESIFVVNTRRQPVPVVQVTQWEYKTAFCVGSRPDCYRHFTSDGTQGWELVAVISAEANPGAHLTWDFIFKRPKS